MLIWGRGVKPRFPRSNPAQFVPRTGLPPAHVLGAARSSHASPQKESAIRHKGMRPQSFSLKKPFLSTDRTGSPCVLTQGRDPQLPVAGEIGASKLKAIRSGHAQFHPRATNTLVRNSVSNFPAPAPCLSPQIASQGQHLMLEQNTQLRRRAS